MGGCKRETQWRCVDPEALMLVECPSFPNLRAVSLRVYDLFLWRGQVLCSTFCHLRVDCRFEAELTAHRLGTKLYTDSPLGSLHHLSHKDKNSLELPPPPQYSPAKIMNRLLHSITMLWDPGWNGYPNLKCSPFKSLCWTCCNWVQHS